MRHLFQRLVEVLAGSGDDDLRRQVQFLRAENEILRARITGPVRTTPAERARLVRLGRPLGSAIQHLLTIVSPRTFARWVNEVEGRPRGKAPARRPGRPRTPEEVRELVLRIAHETDWGYTRILGELRKLGIKVCRSTVINILKEEKLPTGPERGEGTWGRFIAMHAQTLWACDFLRKRVWTALGPRDAYVLVFIHLASRRVFAGASTLRPDEGWVTAQAAAFAEAQAGADDAPELLIHDADTKFSPAVRRAMAERGVRMQRLRPVSPNLNAHVERFIQTIQTECLDRFIALGTGHLDYVVGEYADYYNTQRPHSALGFRTPTGPPLPEPGCAGDVGTGELVCEERLGGLLRHYRRDALRAA